ncbi:hypothetical protein [Glycomyces sp. YM15]|uniref:hypothetical protein n=1 Tax=Glycomyces sp. YM15 TaxID=2800446 RepID=UPI00196497ED|nr:hypothetical protein [Glycomyces sp. YM15]
MNDLIVNPDESAPDWGQFTGARALGSAQALFQSDTGLEYALNGTVAALDLLAFVANPFKECIMAGVGFLIEHFEFLNEPLEWVAGDPTSINATKDTWGNIAQSLDQAGQDLVAELESLSEWEGKDADAYRALIADFGSAISASGTVSGIMSNYMMVMGIWTAVTRGLLLELICDFVSRAIMYALAALASSWFTFGGSIAALIGGLVADAMSVMAKISQHISKLGQAMSQLGQRMGKVGEIIDDIGRALDRFGTGKKFDLSFSSLQKGMDLKFDALSKSIWDDAMPTPGTAGPRSNYQLDNTHSIYDTMNDMFGSGNLPTGWANNAHAWNNVGNILTGYPMTGLKSLLGGGPGAIQDGG